MRQDSARSDIGLPLIDRGVIGARCGETLERRFSGDVGDGAMLGAGKRLELGKRLAIDFEGDPVRLVDPAILLYYPSAS